MNGIINLNKPEGMTSHKAVSVVRRLLGIKKIGHTGTLDPMVSGVLPLCVGAATRLTEYLDGDYKVYEGEVTLGIKTDTQDIWGRILEEKKETAENLAPDQICEAFSRFEGEIMQTPPSYSAVQIKGRRMYEYAREGIEIQAKPRCIHIRKIEIIKIDGTKVRFKVECSKGTYIRTICADIGELLGCGGTMSYLVRTKSGQFNLEEAITLEGLEEEVNNLTLRLLPMDFPLVNFDGFAIKERDAAVIFSNGGFLETDEVILQEPVRIPFGENKTFYKTYFCNIFIGMAEYNHETKKIKAHKVFCREGF